MKSGLEGRNNTNRKGMTRPGSPGLNEVRPRRPEQLRLAPNRYMYAHLVSMKSGLEGRNNPPGRAVAPGRPSRLPVSMKSGLEGRNNDPD